MTLAEIAESAGSDDTRLIVVSAIAAVLGALITAAVNRRGQDHKVAAELRDDLMKEVGALRSEIAAERAARLADRDRFDAREDQLIRWGTWSRDPIPRQPPSLPEQPAPPTAPIPIGGQIP